ncbi:MAG: putative 2OG-Fe(II) oxygenase [Pseudomonadota bacterium]
MIEPQENESLISLFPTPLLLVRQPISGKLREDLKAMALDSLKRTNSSNELLSHTKTMDPPSNPLFAEVARLVTPPLVHFGELLFGQQLQWQVKEAWLNVLQRGGSQYMHSHANSFASAVIFLTPHHESSRTVFLRPAGGAAFVFKNEGPDVQMNPYNADRWVMPEVEPGDMVIYPSYLIHGVPPNQGDQRMTLALNATPDHLNSHGYQVRFSDA